MTNVWIVEDNEGYRRTLLRVINGDQHLRCERVFGSCEDALEELKSGSPPEVLLLDINLPGMDGVTAAPEFKRVAPTTEIIMLTMFSDNRTVFQALCAGASGYLLKTSAADVIINGIMEVVNGGAPMSPQIARAVLNLFNRVVPQNTDYKLTSREVGVLELLVKGSTKKAIADQLAISYHTVDKHVRSIYTKLHVQSVSAAVAKALREKLI